MATAFEKKKQRHASGESTVSTDSVSNYIPTPPDGGYGWVIVFASFLNHVIVDGISFTFGVFYMEFLEYFKAGKAKTALVGSLLCGTYLLTGIIASALVNKFGCRGVCIVGSFIAAGSFILCTFSPSVEVLMVTYGIMGGFGFGLIYLPSVVSVSFYFHKRRALATGIAVCGAGVGCFIFAPAGRAMLDMFDWKNAMLIVAALVLNSCVCGMLMVPLEPRKKRRPRAKNVLDRLKERAHEKLGHKRKDSECSACAHSVHDPRSIKQRVQEVKFAREMMLGEEDSEMGSEMGSIPNSIMNSVKNMSPSRGPSRNSSFVGKVNRQESLISQTIEEAVPVNDNVAVPDIIIEGTDGHNINCDSEHQAMLEKTTDTEKGEEEKEKKIHANGVNGVIPHHNVLDRVKGDSNGHAAMINGSLPSSLPGYCDVTQGKDAQAHLLPSNMLTNDCAHSTGDMWINKPRPRFKIDGIDKEDYARPLYRKDIFYSGSLLRIPHFNSQPDVKTYVKSVTSIPATVAPEKESCIWSCLMLPKAAKDILKEMLDFSLLSDPVFLVAAVANALGMLGMYVPFIFVADRAISLDIPPNQAAFLLSVIGITNTIGRIAAGAMADMKFMNPLLMHNVAVVLCGVTCILNMFCKTYPLMCLNAAVFGLCIATWISLTSIILCNLLGLERLTNAFGLMTMVRGMFVILGPPMAGALYDMTGDYDISFIVGGVILVLAGLVFCLLHLPYFTRRRLDLNDEFFTMDIADQRDIPQPPTLSDLESEAFESARDPEISANVPRFDIYDQEGDALPYGDPAAMA